MKWACDGVVWYEIKCPDGRYHFMMQPFRKGAAGDFKTPSGERKHCWGWDGDWEHPTLTPSFLCETWDPLLDGNKENHVRVHLFLVKGKIQLCGDSNVVTEGA